MMMLVFILIKEDIAIPSLLLTELLVVHALDHRDILHQTEQTRDYLTRGSVPKIIYLNLILRLNYPLKLTIKEEMNEGIIERKPKLNMIEINRLILIMWSQPDQCFA